MRYLKLCPYPAVIADLVRNPEGQGLRGNNKTTQPSIPLSLDGRGIKEPVPVPDTGSEGEQDKPTCHCGLDPPVHRDENDKAFTPLR